MLATIARPTAVAAAIEEPTVSFNTLRRQIDATVIVSYLLGRPDPISFSTPLIAIPGPGQQSDLWTVIWTLVPGPGMTSVFFSGKDGIEISEEELPPRLQIIESSPVQGQPSQWQVTFQNNVMSANSFNYFINAEASHVNARRRRPIHHDPTIVVTQDPIG